MVLTVPYTVARRLVILHPTILARSPKGEGFTDPLRGTLNTIRNSAADELFHRNQPILSVVDIESRFCALLTKADDRDHESWAIHPRLERL